MTTVAVLWVTCCFPAKTCASDDSSAYRARITEERTRKGWKMLKNQRYMGNTTGSRTADTTDDNRNMIAQHTTRLHYYDTWKYYVIPSYELVPAIGVTFRLRNLARHGFWELGDKNWRGCSSWQLKKMRAVFFSLFVLEVQFFDCRVFLQLWAWLRHQKKRRKKQTSPKLFRLSWRTTTPNLLPTLKNHGAKMICANKHFHTNDA